MNEPKISVIIPCYNVSRYVDRCMQAVTSQSIGMECVEIICVDDASTDNTVKKLLAWEQKYPENIIVVQSETNGRQGAARNIGLGYASGEWVAFIDSDDWVEPDYLELLYEKTCIEGLDMVCCETVRDAHDELYYFSDGERAAEKREGILIIDDMKKRKELIHCNGIAFTVYSKLIRKDFLLENMIIFPEGVVYEDIYWGSLINFHINKAYISGLHLYHYYVNGDSTILNKDADYHTDILTVNSMLWREVIKRGFWENYSAEIEYEFLYSTVMTFVKVLILRFEQPPYSLYRLLHVFAWEHVSRYRENPYFQSEDFPELHKLILEGVYMGLDKESFYMWTESIRRIGV
ncbi:MAG: glycosyltransferase [Lachnospiraceae bacterium]|nr:glycosyltransferase [Lachnospiraceae bacterium]